MEDPQSSAGQVPATSGPQQNVLQASLPMLQFPNPLQMQQLSGMFPNPGHLALLHCRAQQAEQLRQFWRRMIAEVEQLSLEPSDFKNQSLPLARIKKIMKSDEDVRMISAEAPILFAKACEMFVLELTMRSWMHSEENKRRTLQRNDITAAITRTDIFDFLVDIVPREEFRMQVGEQVGCAGQSVTGEVEDTKEQQAEQVAPIQPQQFAAVQSMSQPPQLQNTESDNIKQELQMHSDQAQVVQTPPVSQPYASQQPQINQMQGMFLPNIFGMMGQSCGQSDAVPAASSSLTAEQLKALSAGQLSNQQAINTAQWANLNMNMMQFYPQLLMQGQQQQQQQLQQQLEQDQDRSSEAVGGNKGGEEEEEEDDA